jgi:GntR family transcriptional regulator, transcriptional repressor for pyruvate dehydrogenase complex
MTRKDEHRSPKAGGNASDPEKGVEKGAEGGSEAPSEEAESEWSDHSAVAAAPVSRRRRKTASGLGLADDVAEHLKQKVLSGEFSPGTKLPSELALAREFGVNRFTVREAMNQLEQLHLVARRPGAGTVVLEYSQNASVDVIEHLAVTPDGVVNREFLENLLETARVLACGLAAAAAERRGTEHVKALRTILESMRRETNLSRLMWLDFEFHWEIAGAAHNIVPRLVMNSVRGLLRKYIHLLEGLWVTPGSISAGYEHIVAAVESQDAHRARSLMEWIWLGREQRFSDALASIAGPKTTPQGEGADNTA